MAKGIKTDFLNKASGSVLNALNPNQDAMNEMWVSPDGNDTWEGSILRPYKTLTYGFTQINSIRNKCYLWGTAYEEATTVTFPAYDMALIGVGGDTWGHPTLEEPTDGATTLKVNHTVDGSRVIAIVNLSIECNESTASVYPLHLVKTGTAKLYFNAIDVTTEQHTDYPGVFVDASGTSDKFNGDWNGGNINGKITNAFGNASDRWRFNNIKNLDGIRVTATVAGKIEVMNSILLGPNQGYAVTCLGGSAMLVYIGASVGYNASEQYEALTAATSITGEGTGVCICPASV